MGMKTSRFLVDIPVSKSESMLYSTLSRKYYLYSEDEHDRLWEFLNSINRPTYSVEEMNLCLDLHKKGLIVDDLVDEIDTLRYLENKACYRSDKVTLSVYLTNDCNFRCEYCEQPHIHKNIDGAVVTNIISWIDKQSRLVKKIEIVWFGGEPLLRYEDMKLIINRALDICKENNCILYNTIVTNGYLLTHKRLVEMKKMQFKGFQITVDGDKASHNNNRHLINGEGSYDIVLNNLIDAANLGFIITLRMNVNLSNITSFKETLDNIPIEARKNITVSIANIFQEKDIISTFPIKKYAIDAGYLYLERYNNYSGCHTCGHNCLVVNTDGKVYFCTHDDNNENLGQLKEGGIVKYKNETKFHQDVMKSIIDNETCRNCIELPLCFGACKKAKCKQQSECYGKRPDGLTVKEVAMLDYYSDQKKSAI